MNNFDLSQDLKKKIDDYWGQQCEINEEIIFDVIARLNVGNLRVSVKNDKKWQVHHHIKKAILLFFKISKSKVISTNFCNFFDKIPMKTKNCDDDYFNNAEFRMTPGAIIRYGAYVAKHVVLMPSFVNIGAFIDENTMIDSHALVGSCAQIGKRCHISDGVTIGGVLEPVQANPVIVENDCFIGAKSVISEGVVIEEGSIIGAGTIITASTKIISRETNEISYGKIPANSVVVSGSYKCNENLSLSCAVIIKKITNETRKKMSINELLRQN